MGCSVEDGVGRLEGSREAGAVRVLPWRFDRRAEAGVQASVQTGARGLAGVSPSPLSVDAWK